MVDPVPGAGAKIETVYLPAGEPASQPASSRFHIEIDTPKKKHSSQQK